MYSFLRHGVDTYSSKTAIIQPVDFARLVTPNLDFMVTKFFNVKYIENDTTYTAILTMANR